MARRAYGAHRRMTETEKQRNIAQSIAAFVAAGQAWHWADYGVDPASDRAAAIRQLLAFRTVTHEERTP